MRSTVLCMCMAALGCVGVAQQAAAKRAITPDDIYSIQSAGDPQISPDGKLVAYTVRDADRSQNRWHTEIWLTSADGSGTPRQFTGGESSTMPRWSPDARVLAFLSARRDPKTGAMEKTQVYELSMDGGEARRLTHLENGVSSFAWSPDGAQLAVVSKIGPRDSLPTGEKPNDELDYIYPFIKANGQGYLNDQRAHIWVVNVVSGEGKQITFGDQRNDSDPEWSPDGTRIAYTAFYTDKNTSSADRDLFVVPSAGGASVELPNTKIGVSSIQWSPTGDRIAYIAGTETNSVPKIYVASLSGGPYALVNSEIIYPTNLRWDRSGNALYYTAPSEGNVPIFRLDLSTNKVTQLTSNSTIRIMSMRRSAGLLAYVASDDTHPANVFTANLKGEDVHQITHLNARFLSEIEIQPSEPIEFTSIDGWKIQGFLTRPLNWQPGKTYPMVLMIHGGPEGMWGPNFNTAVQCFAARGWAVLKINPRGSSGYGEKFQQGVLGKSSGKAYQDLMYGVDYALAQNKWIDPNRLGVVGHSYGGFMTNWIIGHTDRFKAAVSEDGMSDFVSDDGSRGPFYGHESEFGDFFKDRQVFVANSPLTYAGKVKTPTLILEGGMDMIVPVGQVEEFFRALSHFGVPTELVIFPGEPHNTSRTPNHVTDWVKWEVYWFERWLDNNSNAVKPDAIK